jgi:membrane protease YdiL (CAAX protease family)
MQHEEGNARQNPGRDEPEPLLPGADREPGPEGPGPERPGPGFEPHTLELGIFDRINNYLLLIYAGACLLMNYSLAGLLYFKGMIVLSLSLPGIFSIIFPFFFLSRRSMLGFAREFRFGALGLKTTAVVLVISAAAILPVEAFSSIFERMRPPDGDYTSFILSIKPKGTASFFSVASGIVIVAAVAEELLFRGFVQRIFQRNMNGALAVALAGILFSLSHFNPPVIPGIAALGILYGYIFYKTGNLWYSIIGHAIFNLVTLVRLNYSPEEEIASANVVMPDMTWTFVSLAVFVCALWLLRRLHRAAPAAR